jgi:hypothetical protein
LSSASVSVASASANVVFTDYATKLSSFDSFELSVANRFVAPSLIFRHFVSLFDFTDVIIEGASSVSIMAAITPPRWTMNSCSHRKECINY